MLKNLKLSEERKEYKHKEFRKRKEDKGEKEEEGVEMNSSKPQHNS